MHMQCPKSCVDEKRPQNPSLGQIAVTLSHRVRSDQAVAPAILTIACARLSPVNLSGSPFSSKLGKTRDSGMLL